MVINAENVSKSYAGSKILENIDLEAQKGEIIGVLGSNGAGKSTLVNILTGQISRDSGDITVLGMDPEKNVELRSKLGILPEREDPPSFLTGNEYLDFVSDVRQEKIDKTKWVKRMNLKGKMDKITLDLSKGERQKLMVIQAFFHSPELVFVDEPLTNLDPVIQEEVKQIFLSHRESGKTVFLCTHVISLAEEVCDKVLFLKNGEVVETVENTENLKQRFLETQ